MLSLVRIIVKILLEIAFAVLIFIILVKYTPLFDNIIDKYFPNQSAFWTVEDEKMLSDLDSSDDLNSNTDSKISQDNFFYKLVGSKKVLASAQAEDLNSIKDLLYSDMHPANASSISLKVGSSSDSTSANNQSIKSCKIPRSHEYIPDGGKIAAYNTNVSDDENICRGELRICKNGILLGSYIYPSCGYEIDGVKDGIEVQPGALNTKHNLFQTVKDSEYPVEFINSIRYKNEYERDNLYPINLRGQMQYHVDNRGNTYRDASIPNTVTNYNIDDLVQMKNNTSSDCMTPRGEIVKNGNFAIAYQNFFAGVGESCTFEKRACIDGKLMGGYKYNVCEDVVSPNYEAPTILTYEDNTSTGNFKRGNIISDEIIDLTIDYGRQDKILDVIDTGDCSSCFATGVTEDKINIQ